MSEALFKIFILLILCLTVSSQDHLPQRGECGTLNTEYYYNQKRLAEISEFPWMGRVQYENNGTFWFQCYSVLISDRFMLLNAKCFYFKAQPVRVLLGDWNKGNDNRKSDCDDSGRCAPVPKYYTIEYSSIHPNYTAENKKNDIALIKLSEHVTFSDFIRPICLPSKDKAQINFDNQLLEVTGWYFNASVGQILAKSFVRVVSLNTCELRLKNIYKIDKENDMCAFTCSGAYVYAAGAVLMDTIVVDQEPVSYYLVGLNVYGQAKCWLHNPHVYSRVDRYLDWIYANTMDESSLIMPRKDNR